MEHDCKRNRRNDPGKPFICEACVRHAKLAHRVEVTMEIVSLLLGAAILLGAALLAGGA